MENRRVRPRRRVKFLFEAALLADAEALDIDITAAASAGIKDAVRTENGRRWLEENREALLYYNEWVAEHGLPLAKYRMF
jgi:antitoxin CcdA